jgi:hypothetical protein
MKVTGTVEAVSTKYGKYSILVNEQWYGTKQEWSDCQPNRGDVVEFDNGGGKFTKNMTITSHGDGAPSSGSSSSKSKGGKGYSNLGVELGHAANLAMTVTLARPWSPEELGSPKMYKSWLTETETVHALMAKLRAKHEGADSPSVPVVEAKVPSLEEEDLFA